MATKKDSTKSVKGFSKFSLDAAGEDSGPATVHVDFKSGIGQITAFLVRGGLLINMQSIGTSGDIIFSDVRSGDSLSIDGVCAGNATINVSVPTNPKTPQDFPTGPIHIGLLVD
jgi:hypothetical protein